MMIIQVDIYQGSCLISTKRFSTKMNEIMLLDSHRPGNNTAFPIAKNNVFECNIQISVIKKSFLLSMTILLTIENINFWQL